MNETLEHHGILGMKWGVRRYQNKDGTWTKEGKEHRANSNDASFSENEQKQNMKEYADAVGEYWKGVREHKSDLDLLDQVTESSPIIKAVRQTEEYGEYADSIKAYQDYMKDNFTDNPDNQQKAREFVAQKYIDDPVYDEINNYQDAVNYLGESYLNDDLYAVYQHNIDPKAGALYDDMWAKYDKAKAAADKVEEQYIGEMDYDNYKGKIRSGLDRPAGLALLGLPVRRLDDSDETKHSDDSSEDILEHHGIPGQVHGIRRFQYENGKLTEEGKEGYSKGLTRSGASVFRQDNPKIGQQVWMAKRSMTKVGDLPEETKEKLLERVRQARQGGAKGEESATPEMTREATKTELSPEEREKLKETAPESLGTPEMTREATKTELSPEEREKLRETAPKSLGMTQEMAKTDLSKLSPEEQEKLRKKRAAATKPVEPKKAVTMSDSFEDALEHHGILNMRWGIRRYQNADGSLTPEGRRRYGVGEAREGSGKASEATRSSGSSSSDSESRAQARSASEMTDDELNKAINRIKKEREYEELTGAKPSSQYQNQQNFRDLPNSTNTLSNEELQAYINRLNMEKQYKQLTTPPPKQLTNGQKFLKEVIPAVAMEVGRELVKSTMKKMLGLSGDNNENKNNNNNNNNNNKNKNENNNDALNKLRGRLDESDKRMNLIKNSIESLDKNMKTLSNKSNEDRKQTESIQKDFLDFMKKNAQQIQQEEKRNNDALRAEWKSNAGSQKSNWFYSSGSDDYSYYENPWTYRVNRA